jgi:transcriptional regulator with GAF, ATPase, and Fis domain
LARAANAIAPSAALGLAQRANDGRVSILYADIHGLGEALPAADDLPPVLRPSGDGLLSADLPAAGADRPMEWYLGLDGVERLVSVRVPGLRLDTRLWIGLSSRPELTVPQIVDIEALAETTAALLGAPPSPDAAAEQHRRLELAAGLLPALTRVLDVREVFDRLSTISREALPHDMLMLGVFDDSLTTLTLYAQTDADADLGRVVPQPYPPAFTAAWHFDILDDRFTHPLERDRPPARQGMRSAVRLAIRVDGRVIGGLAFNARDPHRYTSADVVIGRRLADHVAVALSHHRMAAQLAEQARHNEELRARTAKSELLGEVLAAITSSAELPAVFDRISSMTQTVLEHDAMFLAVVLPGGREARIYAKTSKTTPFPDVVPVPPALIANREWAFDLVDDLQAQPDQQHLWTAQHGYRSTLRVPIRLDNEFVAGLNFVSFTPGRYTVGDVAVARRIADRLALAFARDRGAALLKRADEAAERAARLESRVRALTEELDARTGRQVVGESREWRQVLTQATQVAPTETTVLLLGESGTVMEVVARLLHRASARVRGPFIALNCAALPEQLLEAELFGYERGAVRMRRYGLD